MDQSSSKANSLVPTARSVKWADMSAGSVVAARPEDHLGSGGSTPTPALQHISVQPVPLTIARDLIVREHYLHSIPGGTGLTFGVFHRDSLLGALSLGVGPKNGYRLVDGATPDDCLALTRLWLSDELPGNSESRVLGVVLRALKRHTDVKFVISYADPSQGHVGTIYQATGWTYTGLSQSTPLVDLGDGIARHSRSVAHAFGTHSLRHFTDNGVDVSIVPQAAKHRYLYFLDSSYRQGLIVAELPYPRRGNDA